MLVPANPLGVKALEHRSRPQANSNVSKMLPLTTFRTIDLGGRKISGPLFSRFCAKTRVFFEVFSAPEYVQKVRPSLPAGPESNGGLVAGLKPRAFKTPTPRGMRHCGGDAC